MIFLQHTESGSKIFTHFALKGLLPASVGKVMQVVCNSGKTKIIKKYILWKDSKFKWK
jgi:hypothetical protein